MSSQNKNTLLQRLWERCAASGIQPSAAIEQLSALVLLKQLEERSRPGELDGGLPDAARWSTLRAAPPETCRRVLEQEVLPWLRRQDFAGTNPFRDVSLTFPSDAALRETVDLLDALFPTPERPEQWEPAYTALLDLAEEAASGWAKHGGAFYTPPALATLLTALLDPRPGEAICDLACGSGRLLGSAYKHLLSALGASGKRRVSAEGLLSPLPQPQDLSSVQRELLGRTTMAGFDIDRGSALQAWMHLRCLGVDQPGIRVADTLGEAFNCRLAERGGDLDRFDVILANPPFHSAVDAQGLGTSLRALGTTKPEVLFVELALQCLRPGGRAALIVPEGLLFNRDRAHTALRRRLVEQHTLLAIISLPAKLFLPYTAVKTDILVVRRGGKTSQVFCYRVDTLGYTLDNRRAPRPEQTDLPDLLIHHWIHQLNPPGAWLRETQALASCGASSFIDRDTQLCWENVEPERINSHYAFPLIEQDEQDESWRFRGSVARPIEKAHGWMVDRAQMEEDYNLRADLYEPPTVQQSDPTRAERRNKPPASARAGSTQQRLPSTGQARQSSLFRDKS